MKKFLFRTIKDRTFVRFLLVGILNTLFGYSIFAVLIFLGLHYTVAALLSTILGVLFNFKTIGSMVFKNSKSRLIIRFIAVYAVIYCLNVVFLKMLSLWNVNMYLAGLALLFPMAFVAFLMNKYFVFHEKAFNFTVQ